MSAPSSATLERRLGPIDAASVVVSNVIGSGILVLPAVVAIIAPNPWAMLGIWAFGGLLALAGAMAYAEMATLRPRSGGEYVYLREAFGPLAAFLTGWTSFVAGFSGRDRRHGGDVRGLPRTVLLVRRRHHAVLLRAARRDDAQPDVAVARRAGSSSSRCRPST